MPLDPDLTLRVDVIGSRLTREMAWPSPRASATFILTGITAGRGLYSTTWRRVNNA
jgi:hypothetical protein